MKIRGSETERKERSEKGGYVCACECRTTFNEVSSSQEAVYFDSTK